VTAARCSSSATRCSRSTASAKPKCRSSCRPSTRARVGEARADRAQAPTAARRKLVKWFNESFRACSPAGRPDIGAVPYLPASPHESALPGAAVPGTSLRRRGSEEGRFDRPGGSGSRRSSSQPRAPRRDRAALKEAGVRFRALDIEQLGEKQVVQDLYALTRALCTSGTASPGSRACARPGAASPSPISSPSRPAEREADSEYTSGGALIFDRIARGHHLSPDGQKRVEPRPLGPRAAGEEPAARLLPSASRARGSHSRPRASRAENDLEDAEIFLDELSAWKRRARSISPCSRQDRPPPLRQPDVKATKDAVEIMTIHRAKGLEFDTVIVPASTALPRSGRSAPRLEVLLPAGLLLAPIDETGAARTRLPICTGARQGSRRYRGRPPLLRRRTRAGSACTSSPARRPTKTSGPGTSKRSLLAKIWWQRASTSASARRCHRRAGAHADP